MPTKYQVFVDNLSGMTWCPTLGADTLEDAVENITESCPTPSQHWMYYIYILHQEKVTYWGATTDVYRHVKAVAGTLVKPETVIHKRGLEYALIKWSDAASWLFADILF
jgi:hypothetical protein